MNHLINYFYHQIDSILETSEGIDHDLLFVASLHIWRLMEDMYAYVDTLDEEQALNDGLLFNFKAMGEMYINKYYPELRAEFNEERLVMRLK